MVRNTKLKQNDLLDIIKDEFDLKNDKELADFLGVQPAAVSKIRNEKGSVTPRVILIIHDATDWSIAKIKGYLPGSSVEQ